MNIPAMTAISIATRKTSGSGGNPSSDETFLKYLGLSILFVLILFSCLMYWSFKDYSIKLERDRQERVQSYQKYLTSIEYVTIIDVNYEQIINKSGKNDISRESHRVVTIEDNRGGRMNIVQSATPDKVPMKGERWVLNVNVQDGSIEFGNQIFTPKN